MNPTWKPSPASEGRLHYSWRTEPQRKFLSRERRRHQCSGTHTNLVPLLGLLPHVVGPLPSNAPRHMPLVRASGQATVVPCIRQLQSTPPALGRVPAFPFHESRIQVQPHASRSKRQLPRPRISFAHRWSAAATARRPTPPLRPVWGGGAPFRSTLSCLLTTSPRLATFPNSIPSSDSAFEYIYKHRKVPSSVSWLDLFLISSTCRRRRYFFLPLCSNG